jgi:SAM-dependent methyltransferase
MVAGSAEATSTYIFKDTDEQERERLAALQDLLDPATRRHLMALGVGRGTRCLEVAAGSGSIARWLARLVGPETEVVATDLDVRFLDRDLPPNLRVEIHDVLADPLPLAAFDVVHARCILEHLPQRELALQRLVRATRPGGWVLVEDALMTPAVIDLLAEFLPAGERARYRRVLRAVDSTFSSFGADMNFAARLPGAMTRAGLTSIGGEVRTPILTGGHARGLIDLSIRTMRSDILQGGLVSALELDSFLGLLRSAELTYAPLVTVSTWGRRPVRRNR